MRRWHYPTLSNERAGLRRIRPSNAARCAVASTFDFDAEKAWIGEGPANADKPSVLSQRTYGAKAAVPSPQISSSGRRSELRFLSRDGLVSGI